MSFNCHRCHYNCNSYLSIITTVQFNHCQRFRPSYLAAVTVTHQHPIIHFHHIHFRHSLHCQYLQYSKIIFTCIIVFTISTYGTVESYSLSSQSLLSESSSSQSMSKTQFYKKKLVLKKEYVSKLTAKKKSHQNSWKQPYIFMVLSNDFFLNNEYLSLHLRAVLYILIQCTSG